MARQFSIVQIFLWLFVIVLGVEIGGGLYETLLVMPLWSLAPLIPSLLTISITLPIHNSR